MAFHPLVWEAVTPTVRPACFTPARCVTVTRRVSSESGFPRKEDREPFFLMMAAVAVRVVSQFASASGFEMSNLMRRIRLFMEVRTRPCRGGGGGCVALR